MWGVSALLIVGFGLALPWVLARVVTRNLSGGTKFITGLTVFLLIGSMEIVGAGAALWQWLSNTRIHIN